MSSVPIYIPQVTNRHIYVLDWLFKEQFQINYSLVTDNEDLRSLPFFISYGTSFSNSFSIPNAGLLSEQGIKQHEIKTGFWNDIPTLYAADGSTIPFDLFSAIFFLLSRYEEYYPFTPDKHGRYPAAQSILYKQGWLRRPLLDEWLMSFRNLLQQQYQLSLPNSNFSFLPTYDIDIAWSYKNKGFVRTAGAYSQALLSRKISAVLIRTLVLLNRKKDPYDSFGWLHSLHNKNKCAPLFFILAALRSTPFDKNISPVNPAMSQLIKQLSTEGGIGIHPSYYSSNGSLLKKEKNILSEICGHAIHISRQHYIRLMLPDTCHRLIAAGIHSDYSMGYGTHLGFRAATGRSFLWYDLQQEQVTTLRMYPFCFMDSTAHYEEKLDVTEAFEILNAMAQKLVEAQSMLITIFHNFSLGTDSEWRGWKEAYESFIKTRT